MVLKTWKGTIAGFASTGMATFASWKTYIKGIFAGFAADYNLYDGALILGFVLALFALFMIVKDMVDEGGFDKRETQKAVKTGLFMIGLFLGGFLVAKYWAAGTVLSTVSTNADGTAGDFLTTNGAQYTGGSQTLAKDILLQFGTPYVTVGAANDTDYTMMTLAFNQSWITWSEIKAFRGFNITLSQDGINSVKLGFWDTDTSTLTYLLDSTVDTTQTDVTDLGTTSGVNFTWSLADVLTWQASHEFNSPNDYLKIYFAIGSDFTETEATIVNWYWLTCGSDLSYLIVVGFWFLAGFIPFAMQLNLFNKSTYRRKGYRRRG